MMFDEDYMEMLEQFDSMDLELDRYERGLEAPFRMAERFMEDALGKQLSLIERGIVSPGVDTFRLIGNGLGDRLGPASAYEDDLSKMLTRVEASIEGTEIRPQKFPETPSPESFRPGGFRPPDPNFFQQVGRSFYPGLSSHVRYRMGGGKSGARAPDGENYCWIDGQYISKEECKERGCEHFDPDWKTCKWLDDHEDQTSE